MPAHRDAMTTAARFGDPTVTDSIARHLAAVPGTPGCPACSGELSPCYRHLAESLVDTMRNEQLVVLTIEAADQVVSGVIAERDALAARIDAARKITANHLDADRQIAAHVDRGDDASVVFYAGASRALAAVSRALSEPEETPNA